MAIIEPGQIAEVAGPKKASVITNIGEADAIIRRAKRPVRIIGRRGVGSMGWGDGIKRAKRPVLIIGHLAAEIDIDDKKMLDYLLELAQKGNIPVIATAPTNRELLKRGYTKAGIMPAVEVGHRLTDPEWKGIDGKEPYDLAIFVGLPYYMEGTILSGLKHFAPHLKTMTLDNTCQPHASWSFSNISVNAWLENLKAIIEHVED